MRKVPLEQTALARPPRPVDVVVDDITYQVDGNAPLGRVFAVRALIEDGYLTMEDMDWVLDWSIEEPFHLRYLDAMHLVELLSRWLEVVTGVDAPLDSEPNSGPGPKAKSGTGRSSKRRSSTG